jgi:hypothetical protein
MVLTLDFGCNYEFFFGSALHLQLLALVLAMVLALIPSSLVLVVQNSATNSQL